MTKNEPKLTKNTPKTHQKLPTISFFPFNTPYLSLLDVPRRHPPHIHRLPNHSRQRRRIILMHKWHSNSTAAIFVVKQGKHFCDYVSNVVFAAGGKAKGPEALGKVEGGAGGEGSGRGPRGVIC